MNKIIACAFALSMTASVAGAQTVAPTVCNPFCAPGVLEEGVVVPAAGVATTLAAGTLLTFGTLVFVVVGGILVLIGGGSSAATTTN